MVCMSYSGTLKLVDRICEDHDAQVHFWCDDLLGFLNHSVSYTNLWLIPLFSIIPFRMESIHQ